MFLVSLCTECHYILLACRWPNAMCKKLYIQKTLSPVSPISLFWLYLEMKKSMCFNLNIFSSWSLNKCLLKYTDNSGVVCFMSMYFTRISCHRNCERFTSSTTCKHCVDVYKRRSLFDKTDCFTTLLNTTTTLAGGNKLCSNSCVHWNLIGCFMQIRDSML